MLLMRSTGSYETEANELFGHRDLTTQYLSYIPAIVLAIVKLFYEIRQLIDGGALYCSFMISTFAIIIVGTFGAK